MARERISILATASVSRGHQEFEICWLLKRGCSGLSRNRGDSSNEGHAI